MWFKIFKFEVKYRLGQPDLYVYFTALLLCALIAVDFIFEGKLGALKDNAPYVIAFTMVVTSLFFFMVISLLAGFSVLKDFEHRMESLIFSNPISKRDYLAGRFLGSLCAVIFVYLGLLVGIMLNYYMPWKPADMLPFQVWHYVQPFLFLVLPNIVIATALFFVAAALGRKLLMVYTQGIVVVVAYLLLMSYSGPIESDWVLSLIDPFGVKLIKSVSDFWTSIERNQLLLPVQGPLLYNRFIWMGLSAGILLIGYRYFDFTVVRKPWVRRSVSKGDTVQKRSIELPTSRQVHHGGAVFRKLLHQSWFYFRSIVSEVPFLAVVGCGALIIFVNGISLGTAYGVPSFPTTYLIVEELKELSIWFFLLILIFYSGELVWQERQIRVQGICDALPTSDWSNLLAKYFGLVLAYATMMAALTFSGIVFQVLSGFYDIQLQVYFMAFFVDLLLSLAYYSALAIFLHVLVNQKYVGFVLTFVCFLFTMFLSAIGFDHPLINFGGSALGSYSEMNGYGHLFIPFLWTKGYWLSFCLILLLIAGGLFIRGVATSLKQRLQAFTFRGESPLTRLILTALVLWLVTGGYIFYQTNILNTYTTQWEQEDYRVSYEQSLKKYEHLPQPKIIEVKIELDLYPESRDYHLRGSYLLLNKQKEPIREVHVQKYPDDQISLELNFDQEVLPDNEWEDFGYRIFTLEQPLQPGDSLRMDFLQTFETRGFVAGESNTRVVENGTFLNNDYFPSLGYNRHIELREERDRKDAGLPPRAQQVKATDSLGLRTARTGDDGYEIHFEAIISTTLNQVAVTSGSLIDEWTEHDRRYFHYRMDRPMINFYAITSAEYQVMRERWKPEGFDTFIDLEIYYQEGHEQNLQRMMDGMKDALLYFSESFGAYPYDHFRIMEFPRYRTFAQSFPGAVPFAESMGFRLDIDEEEDMDMVYYVTAHEVAHQWWGLQVIAANVAGRHALLETLAQYAALAISRKQYSTARVAKFLSYNEQKYLKERALESHNEQPLSATYGQEYVHYSKGLLNFHHLLHRLLEDRLNQALKRLVVDWNFLDRPNTLEHYATFKDFLDHLEKVTPDSLHYLNEDLFEKITLHDLRVTQANVREMASGAYELFGDFEVHKYYVDSTGVEQEQTPNDWIEVGIYADTPEGEVQIALRSYWFNAERTSINFKLSQKPSRIVIDPLNLFIEKDDRDNSVEVVQL